MVAAAAAGVISRLAALAVHRVMAHIALDRRPTVLT